MSASQDKKKRQQDREAGTDRRQAAAEREAQKQRKSKIQWTIITAIVALLVVVILVANSGLFYSVLPSVKVGDMSYTNGEYQYYYYNSYYQFCNQYSDYLAYFLDTSKPLTSQTCAFDSSKTWAEYFQESALTSITQVTALYEKATAEGYTLSDEDAADIDDQMTQMAAAAESNGYKNTKNYITAVYGRGCNEKSLRHAMEMQAVANDYSEAHYDSFEYSAADLSAWYTENKDEQDIFSYSYYLVSAETEEVTEDVTDETTGETAPQTTSKVTEATMAAAKKIADQILTAAKAGAEEETLSFTEAVAEVVADAQATDSNTAGSSLNSAFADWLKDAKRADGDMTVAESADTGYYVVVYHGRDDNSYKTPSVRHILIKAVDEDGDGTFSDEEKAAAKSKLDDIYAEYKAGDMTEDSFAALAKQYSEDAGSSANGGLYENIGKNRMVQEFNDFCFAEGRKTGDTAEVYGESSSYAGYHLIYFVGYGESYADYLADSSLRSADFSAWQESAFEGYEANTNLVYKFAEK
jgi:parvulin-like peptidyl-prolyl isomerase